MWFKLAGADFSKNNLGTMSSISSSYLIDYTGLTGMSGSPSSVSYAGSSAGTSKTASVVVTVTSGYTFKQGSTITASGGKSGTVFTADKDYTGGQTFTFSMAITANTKLSGTAEATGGSSSGGNTGGGGFEGDEPETPVNPPSGSTVQLTSSNTVFTTTDYHLAAMVSNGPLVTSTQGTKGVMAWDIPAKALVTLTCSPGGNYGMAMTNSDGTLVLETILNSTVATDGNGTYTFSPVLEASRLYVSTAKFVSASYVILSDEELTQYDFNLRLEFTSDKTEGKYISPAQTVGNDVQFADMDNIQYGISETIPANSIITLNVKTGGNYGMCIADVNGKVLQNKPTNNADADGNIVFDKQSVPCKLWVSMIKFNKATYKLGG